MPTFDPILFLLGCVGGVLPEVLRIIRNMHEVDIPSYLGKWGFWLGMILLILVGGVTAWALASANAKDALIYGYASPQILSQLAGGLIPENPQHRGPGQKPDFNLFKWWRS